MKPWDVKKAEKRKPERQGVEKEEKRKAERKKTQDAITSALRNEWMEIALETKTMYGYRVKNADVCFYYGKKPCTKTPDTLNMIARLLAAGIFESGADQVTISNRYHRAIATEGPNQKHVQALQKMLRRNQQKNY